jgi:endonuclease YncB( thermonuclease family)
MSLLAGGQSYQYFVRNVNGVGDGDTFELALELQPQRIVEIIEERTPLYDMGFGYYSPVAACDGSLFVATFRLYPVDAYELRGPDSQLGREAKAFTEEWIGRHGRQALVACTHKDVAGKYGRWLTDLVSSVDEDDAPREWLSVELYRAGLAKVSQWMAAETIAYLEARGVRFT